MTQYVPTPGDRFSFGIWTVVWQGVDVFGPAVQPPMAADGAVREQGETWRDIAGHAPDTDALGRRGMAFEHRDQLALEHLYGIR